MPGRDGTGPLGKRPVAGGGAGMRRGLCGNMSAGPAGTCICPGCGEEIPYQLGTPCSLSEMRGKHGQGQIISSGEY